MRAVDYVTNGFGGTVDNVIRISGPPIFAPVVGVVEFNPPNLGPSGPSGLQYAPVETKIRALLVPFPQYIVEAAVQTYRTRGLAGMIQAKNFGEALGFAFQAQMRFAMQKAERTGYANLGATYKKVILDALNTAASRTGTNPLINSMRTFYTSAIASVPDSSKDPETYIRNILMGTSELGPRTRELGPSYLGELVKIVQGLA